MPSDDIQEATSHYEQICNKIRKRRENIERYSGRISGVDGGTLSNGKPKAPENKKGRTFRLQRRTVT